jgi:hypothetical protein
MAPKSNMDAPFADRPALNATPTITRMATAFMKTSVQIVLLSRDFITSSKLITKNHLLKTFF